MQPIERPILAYAGEPSAKRRRWWTSWLLLGPLLGACIGVSDVGIAATIWHYWGEPDFYFRGGWGGVDFSLDMHAVAGAIAGAAFGAVLLALESGTKRRVRRIALFALTFAVCLPLFFVAHYQEFSKHRLVSAFNLEGASIGVALIFAIILLRRLPP